MCIPKEYRAACEGALARSQARGAKLLECQGANRQLGEDRRRERAEWQAMQASQAEAMRKAEELLEERTRERDDARGLVVVVGVSSVIAGIVVGVLVTLAASGSL